mmetsp:Transcript_30812/g.74426  ORF Transcript_30812/g.74426 Transcript_30812/m.74426 type:complete len:302 (-) Transcript_30812:1744-2649(-)
MSNRQPTWQVKNEGSFASVCVTLPPESGFHCESDAVVTMSQNVDVRGAMSGGLLAGLARAFLTRESFFTTKVENGSTHRTGDALVAPSDPGGVTLHRLVTGEDMILTSGAYLAADSSVNVSSSMQSPFSMFGNYSGAGIFLLRASGRGVLAISAYGSMHQYALGPGEKRSVDNGHLVAWSASMNTSMKLASERAGILGSMTSGEGLHCSFEGPGVVYVQSHKPRSIGPEGARNGGGRNSGNPVAFCIFFLIFLLLLFGFLLAVYLGVSTPPTSSPGHGGYNDRYTHRQQQYGGGYQRQNEF